jgi:hypothetical protein
VTVIFRGRAFSAFGSSSSSTPFAVRALMPSISTSVEIENRRR